MAPTSVNSNAASLHRSSRHLLGGLVSILERGDRVRVVAHALLSLGAAFAGSVAAIVLVPLIQPGHTPLFGGHPLPLPAGRDMLALILAVSIGCFALLRWATAGLAARAISGCAVRLRNRVHARLLAADLATLTESTSAEVANVLTYNIELIKQGVGALLQLLLVGLTAVVSLAFAFWVSPLLTLTLPALVAIGLFASRCFGREQSRVSRAYVADITRLFRQCEDLPRRLRLIRSFERTDAEKQTYGDISESLGRGYRRQQELVASGKLILELFAAVGMAGVFMVVGYWHGVDQGALIAVGLLLGRLLPYLASTRHSFQQLHLAAPALDLWRRYACLEPVRYSTVPTDGKSPTHRLRIESLRLAVPALQPFIEGLYLVPGEMTLVTGDSGVGKSSLADVLAGMIRPATFVARIDGRPVDFDAYRGLMRKGAYVSQGIRPWQRTLRECLHWAEPGATDDALYRVLAAVGFSERLAGDSAGLDMQLQGPSSRLSGGELQRLLLAQVILRQPRLAVLDEATGALDKDSEVRVLAALQRCLPRTILVVVSHRPGLAAIADQCLHIERDGTTTIRKTARPATRPPHRATGYCHRPCARSRSIEP